jgi:hypothetical protein
VASQFHEADLEDDADLDDDQPGDARDPAVLRRRARLCRERAEETAHRRLAEAFMGLAEALEFAAYVVDLAGQRVLH